MTIHFRTTLTLCAALIVLTALGGSAARAADCTPLLDNLFNWAAAQSSGSTVSIEFTLASNQGTFHGNPKTLASYATGRLTFRTLTIWPFRTFSSNPQQYFSDRTCGGRRRT